MALDKDATRIEHCQTLLESLTGKEDLKNTAVWHLLMMQSGCNFFNPDNIIVQYIKTEDALNQMVMEIKGKGAGPSWYQIFPVDTDAPPGTTGIIYLGQDQEFWTFDHQICEGLDLKSGHCNFLDMSKELRDFLCWIPHCKTAHQFSPIVIPATWFGVAYVINFIHIAKHIAKKNKLQPLSERYPTEKELNEAESRPKGPAMQ
ncbi:MAG: hypothetical protein GY861_00760, partial [bacterium]|nr:hypothetical protein [bacterium]